jgi:hypothetical protein
VKIGTLIVFVLAFLSYIKMLFAIRQLVNETRLLHSGVRFNMLWWMPAWKVHRVAYPNSRLRKEIVALYSLTFLLLILAMMLEWHSR